MSTKPKRWLVNPQPDTYLGELFQINKGGDTTCDSRKIPQFQTGHLNTEAQTQTGRGVSNAAPNVQPVGAADICQTRRESHFRDSDKVKDICEGRHGGNKESESAFRSIKNRLTAAQERVLKCIRHSDGLTCNEIAEKLGATPNEISGRCSELKRDGKIYKSGTRLTRSGCPAAILKAV